LKRILTKQKYSDEYYNIIKEKRKKHKQIWVNFKKKNLNFKKLKQTQNNLKKLK
jgi:hypothetical protein